MLNPSNKFLINTFYLLIHLHTLYGSSLVNLTKPAAAGVKNALALDGTSLVNNSRVSATSNAGDDRPFNSSKDGIRLEMATKGETELYFTSGNPVRRTGFKAWAETITNIIIMGFLGAIIAKYLQVAKVVKQISNAAQEAITNARNESSPENPADQDDQDSCHLQSTTDEHEGSSVIEMSDHINTACTSSTPLPKDADERTTTAQYDNLALKRSFESSETEELTTSTSDQGATADTPLMRQSIVTIHKVASNSRLYEKG